MLAKDISVQQARIRAYRPKVVSGCKTCRIRHIKCDEVKPQCRRCTTTGRKCDGYSPRPSFEPCISTAAPMGSTISTVLLPDLFKTAQECRSFFFFREHTVPQISGAFDVDFWRRLVLQASHHELAVRHAACALGALHEQFELGNMSSTKSTKKDVNEEFALQQYLKAISCLLEPMKRNESQAVDVALITCVLFICFETLRGNQGAAISHIDGGVKIISELQSAPILVSTSPSNLSLSSIPYIPLPILNLIFIRLDVQAATIVTQRRRKLVSPGLDDAVVGYQQNIPRSFSSIEEARNSLDNIRTVGARAVPDTPTTIPSDPVERAKIELTLELLRSVTTIRMKQWGEALESFIRHNPTKLDDETNQAILMLRTHKILLRISFKIDSLRALYDETAWDDLIVEFKAIVSLASEFINRSTGSKHASFSFDAGVIFPLYVVAVKCRDIRTRRRAIELLKAGERVEGIVNSLVAARVAERLVAIEEGSLGDGTSGRPLRKAENIARENRVAGVEISFANGDRKAHLRYQKFISVEEPHGIEIRPVVVINECLEW